MIHSIITEVKLSFNLAMVKGASAMADFRLSHLFGIPLKPARVKIVSDVKWYSPSTGWTKINFDGSSIGISAVGSIGFVIRDALANFLGAFAQNIGYATALESEFSACLKAIEKAQELHVQQLWLETDSLLVVKAFTLGVGIPWRLKTRWANCLRLGAHMNCKITHTLREGNLVADSLAKNGKQLPMFYFQWWEAPPNFVISFLHRDSIGLSFSRIVLN
jgi:ribonuclease HI